MSSLDYIFHKYPESEHGLFLGDVERKDKQDWRSAQRLLFPRVRDCLQRAIDGDDHIPPQPQLLGSLFYLKMVWLYVEVFYSLSASLAERIRNAAYVLFFLRIWRAHVQASPHMSLDNHFLSSQTFTDVSLSCHFVVSLICSMRDHHSDTECMLNRTGSDCCEVLFRLVLHIDLV